MKMTHLEDIDLLGTPCSVYLGEGKNYVLDASGVVVGEGWGRYVAEVDALRVILGRQDRS